MLLLCVCVCVYVLLCVCWDGCFSNWNFPLHPDFSIKILKVLVQKCKIRYEKSEARQTNSCTHSHSDADTHSHIADENERMRWVSKHFSWGITLEFFILWGEQVWIKQTFHSILFIHSFMWSIIVTFRVFWQCALNLMNNLFSSFAFHYNFFAISFGFFLLVLL